MATQELVYCHQCGHALPQEARFCPSCGTAKLARASTSDPEEINQTSNPSEPPRIEPAVSTQASVIPEPQPPWPKYIPWGVGVLAIFLILLMIVSGGSGNLTIQQYIQRERPKLEKDLNTPGNNFAQYIENIHLTVTYRGATVKSMAVRTIDGSDTVGPDGNNLAEVDMVITAYWDGQLHKNGYTEVRLVYDPQAEQLKKVEQVDSSAWINTEKIDWTQVGYVLGSMLAL